MMSDWRPLTRDRYDPLKAGSIDGTDTEPHDRAVWRAMNAHYIPPDVDNKPSHTLFVGRLPHDADQEQLHHKFSAFGVVEKIHLIRDIVTGYSKGYCFVEYRKERDAEYAMRESTGLLINGCPVLVDWEAGHRVKGWVPRRLGGGWGGRKEAGQLRFGCRDRPWKKPIMIHPPRPSVKYHGTDKDRTRSQDRHGSSEDRHNKNEDWHNRNRNEDRHNRKGDRHNRNEDRHDRNEDWHNRNKDRHDRNEDRHDRNEERDNRNEDRHDRNEDRHNRNEDRHDRNEDRHDRNEDRHNRNEDRHDRNEDRHNRKGGRHDRNEDRDNRNEDRHDRNEDQDNRNEDRHDRNKDRHNRNEDRDNRNEDRDNRKDFRSKEKKSRREDRRDRHTDSSSSHKRKHTSVSN